MFDPASSMMSLPFNWLSYFFLFFLLSSGYWVCPSRVKSGIDTLVRTMYLEMKTHLGGQRGAMAVWALSTFLLVCFNNIFGLLPWVFTGTSHISATLSLSAPFWMAFVLFSLSRNFTNFMSHMVPAGTPMGLTPFLVIIETVSVLIRPITLAVRLSANMVAGHLLMALIAGSMNIMNIPVWMMSATAMLALAVLEMAVSMIQGYVFATLIVLYMADA